MRTKSNYQIPETSTDVIYDLHQEPIVLSKHLIDILLAQENPADCIGLYTFYYYTAKWQKTNQPKATTDYTAKGLQWSPSRVRKTKNILRELKLIEDITSKKNNVITGHYIKVNFIWSRYNSHPNDFTQCGNSQSVDFLTVWETIEGNTLSKNNLNALSKSIENALSKNKRNTSSSYEEEEEKEKKLSLNDFNRFWKVYPKKDKKGEALKSWTTLSSKKDRPTLKTIMFAVRDQKQTERWSNPQFIPLASTWINQTRWIDDPKEMKIFKRIEQEQPSPNTNGFRSPTMQYREADRHM